MNPATGGSMNVSAMMWAAAFLALALYGLSNMIAGVAANRRRDPPFRIFRALVIVATVVLAVLPGLALALYSPLNILGVAPYCVFMALYCFGIGKRIGFFRARQYFNDLIGAESREPEEEIQNRLQENGIRHPSHMKKVKPIGKSGKTIPTHGK